MKKHTLYSLWLLAPIALWAQADSTAPVDIDLSDVIVVEDTPTVETPDTSTVEVVEIPDAPIEGASIDASGAMEAEEAPAIPVVTESLPTDMEIVLEIPGQEAANPGAASMSSEETISVDFPDEDVRTILRNVADLFELNLVIPDTLQGRTSIKLRNITWRQAFEVVLEPLGYTYVEDRNIIRIRSIEELTTEPVDTRVFVVNYAAAAELQSAIAPLVDTAAGGRLQVDVRSNALVITERPSRMNKIQEIIERLDRATDQVMIESKFIEVTRRDVKNIGVNWTTLSGQSLSVGGIERQWDRTRESGSDATINNVNDSGFSSGGGVSFDQANNFVEDLTRVASTTRADSAVFSASQFEVILSALKEDNDSKLVANPTVVTMNNKTAVIKIVTEIPQVEFTFNAETGSREANGLAEPLEFGTEIEVKPQVNAAGFINLEVTPSVSNQTGIQDTEVGPQPIISRRVAQTNVTIKDGYTLALGGLTQNDELKSETRVPLLGDLPGIGRLFRSNSDQIEQKNLIIFITAKTLNPDGSTYRDVVDPRVINSLGIVPSELPGYVVSAEEQALLDQLEAYRVQAAREKALEGSRQQLKAIEYKKMQEAKDAANASDARTK